MDGHYPVSETVTLQPTGDLGAKEALQVRLCHFWGKHGSNSSSSRNCQKKIYGKTIEFTVTPRGTAVASRVPGSDIITVMLQSHVMLVRFFFLLPPPTTYDCNVICAG